LSILISKVSLHLHRLIEFHLLFRV
jgi:hypothetical protein